MEIKITADKKLLEAIDKLAEAIKATQLPQIDAMTALPVKAEEEPAQSETAISGENKAISEDVPLEESKQETLEAPTREEVQRIAVAKIQAKLGKQVKALIEKHGGTRVSDVPEKNLAAFKADLEKL